jgi:hypothetical protein
MTSVLDSPKPLRNNSPHGRRLKRGTISLSIAVGLAIALLLVLSIPLNSLYTQPGHPAKAVGETQSASLQAYSSTYCNLTKAPTAAGRDVGSNSYCFSSTKMSWSRQGGNFTLEPMSLVLSTASVPITMTSLKNSTVVGEQFSQSVTVGATSCTPNLQILFRNVTSIGPYDRDIVISGSLGCSVSYASLSLALVNSRDLPASTCDTSPHLGYDLTNETLLPACTMQMFGNMGFSWGDISGATYDNSTDVLTIPLTSTFSFDPLALDGDGATDSNPSGTTTTVSLTTSNANDIIVLAAGSYYTGGACTISSVVDNLGTHLTWTSRGNSEPDSQHFLAEYYSSAWSSSGSITLTVTWSTTCTSVQLNAFGVTGANTGSPFDPNSGLPAYNHYFATSSQASVTLSTSNPNDFIFGFVVDNSVSSNSICSGFTNVVEGSYWSETIYEIVSSTQSNLNACINLSPGEAWMELGDAIQLGPVTQPITCTTARSGTAATVTLSGAGVTPTTLACNGTEQYFAANPSSTITLTVPTDGSNSRYRFSGPSTTSTVSTCSSGLCTNSQVTIYYQFSQSVAYSITCNTGATCSAPTIAYQQAGSVTTPTLSITATTYWIDYNTMANASTSVTDNLGNSYTPYLSSWLITGQNVVNSPITYWCGL